ncbi:MAG: MBL fold metallo-hydrolase [Anaerolineae bacterium]
MIIERVVAGPFQVNCYLVGCEETKEGIIIDPGAEGDRILGEVERLDLNIVYIINTHGHIDHISSNKEVKEGTGAPLAIHQADAPLLTAPPDSFALMFGLNTDSPPADLLLKEGDTVQFGNHSLAVLHTPGHSRGGISLVGDGLVFTGDALFNMGIGRTDLPGGDYHTLIKSIKSKLLTLPDETVAYPGHGPSTTIGREKRVNPFIP